MNAVCLDVYSRKGRNRIAWIGDYADSFLESRHLETFNGLNNRQIKNLTTRCWKGEGIDVPTTDFTLNGLYLINHTKQEYIDCSAYFKASNMNDGWCLHPLPLLTCIGNGLGGGDYNSPTDDSTEEYVGCWAWDEIKFDLEILFKNNYFLLTGYCGTWHGNMEGGKFINTLPELLSVMQHLDDFRIIDRNGHFIIEGSHHDGSDRYELKRLTRKGYELANNNYFANTRELHNTIMKNNLFSGLPHFAQKVYCL